jgi:hypothetical protein
MNRFSAETHAQCSSCKREVLSVQPVGCEIFTSQFPKIDPTLRSAGEMRKCRFIKNLQLKFRADAAARSHFSKKLLELNVASSTYSARHKVCSVDASALLNLSPENLLQRLSPSWPG